MQQDDDSNTQDPTTGQDSTTENDNVTETDEGNKVEEEYVFVDKSNTKSEESPRSSPRKRFYH